MQVSSNLLRQKRLQSIHEQFLRIVNENCYPAILEIFQQYKKIIKQQADINNEIRRIGLEYEEQRENRIVVDKLRRVLDNELMKLAQNCNRPTTTQHRPNPPPPVQSIVTNERITFDAYNTTMHGAIKQAEDNAKVLDKLIKQLKEQQKSLTQK